MTLPPPPDSFFEGGKPQSQVDPGETSRELLHEIKNLSQAVVLLSAVTKKQRQRQARLLIVFLVSAISLTTAIGYTRLLSVQQTQQRILSGYQACSQDNARGDLEIEILQAAAKMNAKDMRAQAFYLPRIAKFQALHKNCARLYPLRGQPGFPTFWGADDS